MTETRKQWHSRTPFFMAAVGSAVGPGNVWRFPYVAYESGGGASNVQMDLAVDS